MEKNWKWWQVLFSWTPKSLWAVTAAKMLKDDCSLEGSYDKPRQLIKKQKHHFADKGPYSQSYIFFSNHEQMWEWTIKKAYHQRIDTFELWCWRRLLRALWTARRSNQSILKEINVEYSLKGLLLKLKLHLMWRANSLKKTLMLGKTEGKKKSRKHDEMVRYHHWLSGHEFEESLGDIRGMRSLVFCSPWGCGVGTSSSAEQ